MSLNLCGGIGANTGPIACDTKRGRVVTIAIGGTLFDVDDVASPASFKSAFKAATRLATGDAGKLYGLPENVGIANKTAANKEGTLGTYGPPVTLVEGKPAYEFQLSIGVTLEKALRAFNGKQVPVFLFDDQKNMWGCLDGNGNFVGYDAILFCTPKPFEDGATPGVTIFAVSLISASQYGDDDVYYPATNMSVTDFVGLKTVVASFMAAQTTNTAKVALNIPTSQYGLSLNIYDDYQALLSGAGKVNWKAIKDSDVSTITITSITADTAGTAGTPAVSATATYTVTKGATNDTVDIKPVGGVTASGGAVTQTGSESTDTLLTVKIKNAINAATLINGGYTATNAANVLTVIAPLSLGATVNGDVPSATIVGTITVTPVVNFSGGVTYVQAEPVGKGFIAVLDATQWAALPSGATVSLGLVDPTTLDAANITGIEQVDLIQFVKP